MGPVATATACNKPCTRVSSPSSCAAIPFVYAFPLVHRLSYTTVYVTPSMPSPSLPPLHNGHDSVDHSLTRQDATGEDPHPDATAKTPGLRSSTHDPHPILATEYPPFRGLTTYKDSTIYCRHHSSAIRCTRNQPPPWCNRRSSRSPSLAAVSLLPCSSSTCMLCRLDRLARIMATRSHRW